MGGSRSAKKTAKAKQQQAFEHRRNTHKASATTQPYVGWLASWSEWLWGSDADAQANVTATNDDVTLHATAPRARLARTMAWAAARPSGVPSESDAAGPRPSDLRVLTYNILAQTYFENNPRQQATMPTRYRPQPARHAMLMAEIDSLVGETGVDGGGTVVLCLQEVEGSYLGSTLRPALVARGYQVRYLQKVGGVRAADENRRLEGVALCWRGPVDLVQCQVPRCTPDGGWAVVKGVPSTGAATSDS
jgi:hypothetical protein